MPAKLLRESIMRGHLVVALAVMGVLSLQAQAQSALERMKGRGQIVVTYREDAAPFSFVKDGQPTGYSLEFCRAIVETLQKQPGMAKLKVAYTPVAVDRMLTPVNEGSADLLCSGTSDNAARRRLVAFSRPIYIDGLGVMVRRKDGIRSLAQLDGKKLAAIKGTTAVGELKDYQKAQKRSWKLEEVLNGDVGFSQLQLGWASGYARDRVLLALQRATSSAPDNFVILDERLSKESIAIAFRPDDAAMQSLVDGVIGSAIQSGKATEWYERWFIKPIPLPGGSKALNVPMSDALKAAFAGK
jgi:glutamate/aspartate transport system substrate-binding protein